MTSFFLHGPKWWIYLFYLYSIVSGNTNPACQVVYFALFVVAELAAAEAVAWLPKKRGSKQATLAAKNEWMQWRTANRFENSSSWKENRNGSDKIKINSFIKFIITRQLENN